MGFEPTRAEHIGLAVQHLNHSATSSLAEYWLPQRVALEKVHIPPPQKRIPTPGVEPGPPG